MITTDAELKNAQREQLYVAFQKLPSRLGALGLDRATCQSERNYNVLVNKVREKGLGHILLLLGNEGIPVLAWCEDTFGDDWVWTNCHSYPGYDTPTTGMATLIIVRDKGAEMVVALRFPELVIST